MSLFYSLLLLCDKNQTRAITRTMVTKKIRTEYMKKFRDPKWETFSKCYEDSLKYRLTRRVMEHSHKPWFWEGWDNGSDSSGWSTPRLTRNKIAPLSLPPPAPSEGKQTLASPGPKPPSEEGRTEEVGASEAPVVDAAATAGKEIVTIQYNNWLIIYVIDQEKCKTSWVRTFLCYNLNIFHLMDC